MKLKQSSFQENNRISGQFSIALDSIRIYSALCVFVYHINSGWYGDLGIFGFIHGHDAVVVFFVLSGFVIAYSQRQKKRDFFTFMNARLTRLYSTLLPAILLTAVSIPIVIVINPDFAKTTLKSHELIRFIACSLFIQEHWFRNLTPGFNLPFWSLGYELSYYFMFAIYSSVTRFKTRCILLLLCFLFVGPTILLLFPAWIVGVMAEQLSAKYVFSKSLAWIAMSIGIAIFAIMTSTGWTYPNLPGHPPLNFSSAFLSDWITSVGIGLILLSLRKILVEDASKILTERVRWLGDLTFPIYVCHFPIIVLIAAFSNASDINNGPYNPLGATLGFVVTILISMLLEVIRFPLAGRIKRILEQIRGWLFQILNRCKKRNCCR